MEEICFETKAIEGRYVAAKLLNSDQSKTKYNIEEPIVEFFYSNDEHQDKSIIKDKKIGGGCFIGEPQYVSFLFNFTFPSGLQISKHRSVTLSLESISSICQWLDNQLTEEEKEKNKIKYDPTKFEKKPDNDKNLFTYEFKYTEDEINKYLSKKKELFEDKKLLAEEAIKKITNLQSVVTSTEEKIFLVKAHKSLLRFQRCIEHNQERYERDNFLIEYQIKL